MVIHIKTKDRDGNLLEGNGLLFYAKKYDGTVCDFPLILTLWHVVGLRQEDNPGYNLTNPNLTQFAEFRIPGLPGYTYIQEVVDKFPLSQIDPPIASSDPTKEDGLCLLKPSPGFIPTVQSPTLLGIPHLDPVPILSMQVAICFNQLQNDAAQFSFMPLGAQPRKRGACDSYDYPGPQGFVGSGCSGSAILPNHRPNNPPEVVFGLHWGSRQSPNPPNNYIFFGTQNVLTMLRRSGYFYSPYDKRNRGESQTWLRRKAENFCRWALEKLTSPEGK